MTETDRIGSELVEEPSIERSAANNDSNQNYRYEVPSADSVRAATQVDEGEAEESCEAWPANEKGEREGICDSEGDPLSRLAHGDTGSAPMRLLVHR